ncbi:MAG: RNA polymerase factor sigma-54 [Gammaproteobacteria bacterium]|nr:RNA polymerase factor sigma-54 [Gammaproteobacteria bacterium]
MKQSLQLRVSQQLTMTPQLQQAIKMLQLSTLELQLEVQQALDSNLMLEEGEENEGSAESDRNGDDTTTSSSETTREEQSSPLSDSDKIASGADNEQIPDELPIDSNWDDIYDITPISGASASAQGEEDDSGSYEHSDEEGESLSQFLLEQLQLVKLSPRDHTIALTLIDAINRDGFITTPLEEFEESLNAQGTEVEMDEIITVLHILQNLDPPGIAARTLQESLLLQLKHLQPPPHNLKIAQRLLELHFEQLANRDYPQLKRRLKLSDEALAGVIHLIQGLNPRPAGQLGHNDTQYIVPDVFVTRGKESWSVELNSDTIPKLRINNHYAGLIRQVRSEDSNTLKSHLQEAKWFIKSIQSRNETLLKVASSIVAHQRAFLEQGEVAMKPMVLLDIATELGMHESTISRTTTRKYMHTPQGIFELKYFFSSHVATSGGGECSSTAIRAMLKSLIAAEPVQKPLSDNKLAGILSDRGINVARRTIAKYREAMGIPPSNERKRLA